MKNQIIEADQIIESVYKITKGICKAKGYLESPSQSDVELVLQAEELLMREIETKGVVMNKETTAAWVKCLTLQKVSNDAWITFTNAQVAYLDAWKDYVDAKERERISCDKDNARE